MHCDTKRRDSLQREREDRVSASARAARGSARRVGAGGGGARAVRGVPSVGAARFNSFSGAVRAAERAGKKEKAKAFRERLAALCGGSVPARAQTAAADSAREA